MKTNEQGEFEREESGFRRWVTQDGQPGPTGEGGFLAESGRYHLYVSYACPWAHRTLLFRVLKGLEDSISVSVVHPVMPEESWVFGSFPESTPDHVHGFASMQALYKHVDPTFSDAVTVPVLYDKQRDTIVSNESSEIIRMLNSAFTAQQKHSFDYYPAELVEQIDEVNAFVLEKVNNGVYLCGFATEQPAYEKAVKQLFSALDELENTLSQQRYLLGNVITEADWRLFPTLLRFDAVYFGHFKCNLKQIKDYPNLWNYVLELYQWPGVAATINMPHIKTHYYGSHPTINPTGIIPVGPLLDFNQAHNRDQIDRY